jgi:hypothetical protein
MWFGWKNDYGQENTGNRTDGNIALWRHNVLITEIRLR